MKLETRNSKLETIPCCPICGTEAAEYKGEVTDFLLGTTESRFKSFRCGECTAVYLYPPPGREEIGDFYPDGYWWQEAAPGDGLQTRIVHGMERAYRNFVLGDHLRFLLRAFTSRSRRTLANSAELLDVGCSSGAFLNLCRKHGFKVYGLEASAAAVEHARTVYRLQVCCGSIEDSSQVTGRKYDVITMFHVLEHLLDPMSALRHTAEMLKPCGHLIVQVPNIDSVQARLFKARWYGMDPPRHLVNFNARALNTALERAGFKIESISYFSLRDNAPALVSSLFPNLDPMRRKVKQTAPGNSSLAGLKNFVLELIYFFLVLTAQPLAMLESAVQRGATIMIHAVRKT